MSNDKIIDMARALGRALQEDERYISLDSARTATDDDSVLQEALGRYNLARINLNSEVSKETRDDARISELSTTIRDAYDEIMANQTMEIYNKAQTDVNSMINYINAIITASANGENPDAVEEPSGECSGSCESCDGCH